MVFRAVLWAVAGFVLFGGMFLWPVCWFFDRHNRRRLKALKVISVSLLLLQTVAFAFVAYCRSVSPDWLHCLLIPYGIGLTGVVVGVGVILWTLKSHAS